MSIGFISALFEYVLLLCSNKLDYYIKTDCYCTYFGYLLFDIAWKHRMYFNMLCKNYTFAFVAIFPRVANTHTAHCTAISKNITYKWTFIHLLSIPCTERKFNKLLFALRWKRLIPLLTRADSPLVSSQRQTDSFVLRQENLPDRNQVPKVKICSCPTILLNPVDLVVPLAFQCRARARRYSYLLVLAHSIDL